MASTDSQKPGYVNHLELAKDFLDFYQQNSKKERNGRIVLDADAGDGRRTLQIAEGIGNGVKVYGVGFSGNEAKALRIRGEAQNLKFYKSNKQIDRETGKVRFPGLKPGDAGIELHPGQLSAVYLGQLLRSNKPDDLELLFSLLGPGGMFYTRLDVSALYSSVEDYYKIKKHKEILDEEEYVAAEGQLKDAKDSLSASIRLLEKSGLFTGGNFEFQIIGDEFNRPIMRTYKLKRNK